MPERPVVASLKYKAPRFYTTHQPSLLALDT